MNVTERRSTVVRDVYWLTKCADSDKCSLIRLIVSEDWGVNAREI